MHRRTCARTAPRRVVEQCCYLSLPWTNHVSSPTPHQRATLPSQRIMNAAHTSATTSHPSLAHCSSPMLMARRYQHNNNNNNNIHALDEVPMEALMDDTADLHTELESAVVDEATHTTTTTTTAMQDVGAEAHTTTSSTVVLERINAPPGRFDLLTNSLCYTWKTTAQHARKVSGPMREWSSELKYRTGVHIEVEPTYPQRLSNNVHGGDAYATADEVDMTVYLFGSERGIFNCRRLMESAIEHDACYVRVGVFRRVAHGDGVEWLTLRRINHDLRPPDIPPISLKHPGKWCLMYENVMEAAVRSVWEETGITLNPAHMYPSARLVQHDPTYYWRVPVMYFVAEVAPTVEVLGPQVMQTSYMQNWDVRLLRQSPDAMDRAWAQHADPTTGCAWMRGSMIDALQMPLRGANYMATRYTPPPHAELNEVVGLHAEQQHSSSTSLEDGVGDASATQVPKE